MLTLVVRELKIARLYLKCGDGLLRLVKLKEEQEKEAE
jgi:hypothetical protein